MTNHADHLEHLPGNVSSPSVEGQATLTLRVQSLEMAWHDTGADSPLRLVKNGSSTGVRS